MEYRKNRVLSLLDASQAVLIQSLGPLSYFVLILVITQVWGAEVQGQYAQAKAWVDFSVAFGALGLAQGVTYALNKSSLVISDVLKLGAFFGVITFCILFIAALLLPAHTTQVFSSVGSDWVIAALITASSVGVMASIWRGGLLSIADGVVYSVATVFQPLTLLLLVCVLSLLITNLPIIGLMSISYSVAAAFIFVSLLVLKTSTERLIQSESPHAQLRAASFHAFLQNVSMALVPLLSIWLLQVHGASLADIGVWSVAAAVFQIIASPVAMIAPMLFSRWSSDTKTNSVAQAKSLASLAFIVSLPFTLVLVICTYNALPWVFGEAFSGASMAASILAASTPLIVVSRILSPLIFATDNARLLSGLYFMRLLCILALSIVLLRVTTLPPSVVIAISWTTAEAGLTALCWHWLGNQILNVAR